MVRLQFTHYCLVFVTHYPNCEAIRINKNISRINSIKKKKFGLLTVTVDDGWLHGESLSIYLSLCVFLINDENLHFSFVSLKET